MIRDIRPRHTYESLLLQESVRRRQRGEQSLPSRAGVRIRRELKRERRRLRRLTATAYIREGLEAYTPIVEPPPVEIVPKPLPRLRMGLGDFIPPRRRFGVTPRSQRHELVEMA